jgi:hypothetical protein
MIDAIGDSAVKGAARVDLVAEVGERSQFVRQEERLRAERPVQEAEEQDAVQLRLRQEAENKGSAKYVMEKNRLFYEKYDKNGDLILRMPPESLPVDEIV